MRSPSLILGILSFGTLVACGNDSTPSVDGASGNHPPARVIAGGGIGDGAIDGVVNLYVIDDDSRTPIANAEVRVGTVSGTTDATGLFVAEDVVGPQDVVVKASGHRSEMWVGANGANMTFNLEVANTGTPNKANLSGTITGWTGLTVAAGHAKLAVIAYSSTDDFGDPANEIAQTTDNQNVCITTIPTDPCNFVITTRTGKVALIAAIFDRDLKGTPTNPADDTQVLIGWASRQGITVADAANQTGQDLGLVPVGMQQTVTVDFGSPPASLPTVAALVGIDLGADGVFQLPLFVTPTAATLPAPKPAAFAGSAGYRLTGIANNGSGENVAQSIVLRRDLAGPTLSAGSWLAPPTGVSLTRTGGSWTNASGATVHSFEIKQGGTAILNLTVFDSTRTQVTLPDLISLPSGSLSAALNAIAADDFDVTNFSLDAERTKLNRVAGQAATIN